MAKKYYSTKVVGIGGEAEKFSTLAKMIVIFDDSMVLPELRNFSVLHSGNKLTDVIKPGDTLKIADSEFKILNVGGDVNNNIKSLGHIVIKFNDDKEDLMEGSIHVEDKPIPKIRIGDEIAVIETSSQSLIGKTVAISGGAELSEAVAQILKDSGAQIVDGDADIIIKVK